MKRFEKLYIMNKDLKNNKQSSGFEHGMEFDFSNNNLKDSSVKFFAEIIKKFNGFSTINMKSLGKIKPKDTGFCELAKAIRENISLINLDIRHNSIP